MKEVHGLIYTFSEWEVEGTLNCSGQESEERLSKLQKIFFFYFFDILILKIFFKK
jgi:hypothetical protein